MPKGIFGNLFDLNTDGDLDIAEQVLEFAVLDDLLKDDDEDEDDDFDIDLDSDSDE